MLTYLRDDKRGLPWANMWDLPGGGRDGEESPEACVLREVELGLRLSPERLEWRRVWPSMMDAARLSVFYVGRIEVAEIAAIRFGDAGQSWQMCRWRRFWRIRWLCRNCSGGLGWRWGSWGGCDAVASGAEPVAGLVFKAGALEGDHVGRGLLVADEGLEGIADAGCDA